MTGRSRAGEDSVEFDVRTTGGCCTCCCAGEGLFNTKLTGPGEVFLQSYSHGPCGNQISGAPRDIVPVEVREGPRSISIT